MLVERYVPGRELTVAVMGDRALPVIEILSRAGWYDYDSKYAIGGSKHLCPAPVHPDITRQAGEIAVAAHRALGCRGVSRADFRYDDTGGEPGRLYLLEVNTQPGMTPTSLVPDAAKSVGISYGELVAWMVENASCDA
jgi:D-alanine-D-alanine ligase